ncbi:MAG: Ig-like domain-containing protein [Bacteroidales bacterium]|nr:Ig-like domain-containing protein [Bacteroidales bacterium]
MRKFLRFSLMSLFMLVSNLSYADAYKTLTFPDDNSANNKISAYTEEWVAKIGTDEWTIANFNNYKWDGWTYIRCGRKNTASVASIATNFAIDKAITSVCVTIDKVSNTNKINSISLIVASDKDFTNTVETQNADISSLAAGDLNFSISNAAANMYYKLVFDIQALSSNGNIQISKVQYNVGESGLKSAGLSFSQSSISIKAGTEFTAPTFTKKTDATVTFATDNAEVATVSNDGVISLAGGIGTATITATSPATSSYEAGNATCKIEVYAVNVYKKATSITSGESYLLVAQRDDATRYAIPLKDTYSYGYLSTSRISGLTETIEVNKKYDDGFVLTAMDGGYSIKDCYGRYLYQSGTHNSFNVGETPQAWTIESQADGTFKISMNGYFMQYGQGTYTTFGVYTEAQDGAVLPMLYKFDDKATGIDTINGNSEVVRATGTYNLAGQRVDSSYKGIVIKNGKKVLVK